MTTRSARPPAVHRRVLTWLANGEDHDGIVERLGIDRAAVGPLVVVASASSTG